jgi:hypothetical protein
MIKSQRVQNARFVAQERAEITLNSIADAVLSTDTGVQAQEDTSTPDRAGPVDGLQSVLAEVVVTAGILQGDVSSAGDTQRRLNSATFLALLPTRPTR